MKERKILPALLGICLVMLWQLLVTDADAHIYRLDNQTQATYEQMLDDLAEARVIFIGESHDNAAHHQAQLQVIKGLYHRGVKLAVGLEMFRSDSQDMLDRWVYGSLSLPAFVEVFNDNWSDWNQYRDIFHFSYYKEIPLVGLNLSRAITSQVAEKGFDSLSKTQLNSLPPVTCNVDRSYEDFIKRALKGHIQKELPFTFFCEAQLLWDKVMADNVKRFLEENNEYSIVVLAGSGHSWKHGIPRQLQNISGFSFRVLLPEVVNRADTAHVSVDDADYLLLGVEEAPLH